MSKIEDDAEATLQPLPNRRKRLPRPPTRSALSSLNRVIHAEVDGDTQELMVSCLLMPQERSLILKAHTSHSPANTSVAETAVEMAEAPHGKIRLIILGKPG